MKDEKENKKPDPQLEKNSLINKILAEDAELLSKLAK